MSMDMAVLTFPAPAMGCCLTAAQQNHAKGADASQQDVASQIKKIKVLVYSPA